MLIPVNILNQLIFNLKFIDCIFENDKNKQIIELFLLFPKMHLNIEKMCWSANFQH